jgi:NADH-quinone oxidoreductase subunit A
MIPFLGFLLLISVVIIIILALIYFINIPTNDYEKHSAYECGFEPFGDARSFFDIHFYTIGLLFIIFDLEIVFLIPFAVNIESTLTYEYINFILFMLILLVGFYYE